MSREEWKSSVRKAQTENQNRILKLLAEGWTRKQIAGSLSITLKGFDWHWREIRNRFKVQTQFEIALLAREAGIV